jgi:hypothetical protein
MNCWFLNFFAGQASIVKNAKNEKNEEKKISKKNVMVALGRFFEFLGLPNP